MWGINEFFKAAWKGTFQLKLRNAVSYKLILFKPRSALLLNCWQFLLDLDTIIYKQREHCFSFLLSGLTYWNLLKQPTFALYFSLFPHFPLPPPSATNNNQIKIVASRWREAFYLTWYITYLKGILLGGGRSGGQRGVE